MGHVVEQCTVQQVPLMKLCYMVAFDGSYADGLSGAGAILWCTLLRLGKELLFKHPLQKVASIGVRTKHVSVMYAEMCGSMVALMLVLC